VCNDRCRLSFDVENTPHRRGARIILTPTTVAVKFELIPTPEQSTTKEAQARQACVGRQVDLISWPGLDTRPIHY
jgi:hypothetical protein